jgi:hypothetical protein
MDRKRVVVMGFMGGCPIAGVVWQHLHYIVGLQRLGHEVYYIEDSSRFPYDPVAYDATADCSYAVRKLAELGAAFGFEGRWAFRARYTPDHDTYGLESKTVDDLYRTADAILNVCGAQEMHEELLQSRNLVYVESDPGVEQIRVDKGEAAAAELLSHHRALFTFGEHVGTDKFPVPLHQFRWMPTRQPVVCDFWETTTPPPGGAVFTSVANWNTRGKDIEWRGDKYLWSKSLEFLKFIQAPLQAGETFELATKIRDPETVALFEANRWRLSDGEQQTICHDEYRRFLQNSKGEFTVAKDQYVRLHTGWFSDRSACYLAAGRPVITQETGFTALYGGSEGLFAFSSLEQIPEAVRAINADYAHHSEAARQIAREHFEATKVLASLLERAGV